MKLCALVVQSSNGNETENWKCQTAFPKYSRILGSYSSYNTDKFCVFLFSYRANLTFSHYFFDIRSKFDKAVVDNNLVNRPSSFSLNSLEKFLQVFPVSSPRFPMGLRLARAEMYTEGLTTYSRYRLQTTDCWRKYNDSDELNNRLYNLMNNFEKIKYTMSRLLQIVYDLDHDIGLTTQSINVWSSSVRHRWTNRVELSPPAIFGMRS